MDVPDCPISLFHPAFLASRRHRPWHEASLVLGLEHQNVNEDSHEMGRWEDLFATLNCFSFMHTDHSG
jgi:hypothetical protein